MYIESSEHNHCWLQPAWLNLPKLMTFLLCPVCLFPISSLYDAFFSSPFLITSQLIATNRHLLLLSILSLSFSHVCSSPSLYPP